MGRRRASMREGPLADLFRATEAAQRQSGQEGDSGQEAAAKSGEEPDPDATVESAAPLDEAETSSAKAAPAAPVPDPPATDQEEVLARPGRAHAADADDTAPPRLRRLPRGRSASSASAARG